MVKDCGVAVRPDSVAVVFDDERLVADAGVVLTSTLIRRLGLERLVDEMVGLGGRPGAARPGRKVCSLVHAMALGPIRSTIAMCCGPAAPRRCLDTV